MNTVQMNMMKFTLKKDAGVRIACFRLAAALDGQNLSEFPVSISRAMDALHQGRFEETRLKDGTFAEQVFELFATSGAEKITFTSWPEKVTLKVDQKTASVVLRMDLRTEASRKIALYGLDNFGEFVKVGMQEVQLPLSA